MEKAMAPHSSTVAWKIPWMEEPGRLQSMGSLRVGHNWGTSLSLSTFHFHALEKEMATHSSVLAWRIPGMGEPGGLPSMGSHRVGHNWNDLAAWAPMKSLKLPFWDFFNGFVWFKAEFWKKLNHDEIRYTNFFKKHSVIFIWDCTPVLTCGISNKGELQKAKEKRKDISIWVQSSKE